MQKEAPALWQQVLEAKIFAAAVFSWPATRVSTLEFRGHHHTPCGGICGPMLEVVDQISHSIDGEAWLGLSADQVERCGGEEILWAHPRILDAPGLGARLSIAAASFAGLVYQPRPHSPEGEAYSTVLVEEAALIGDITAMREAVQHFGLSDGRDYGGALWTAARRGDRGFLRSLVRLVGPDVLDDVRIICENPEWAWQDTLKAMHAVLKAGLPIPADYRPALLLWRARDSIFSVSFVGQIFLTQICARLGDFNTITTRSVIGGGLLDAATNPELIQFMLSNGAAPEMAFELNNPVDLAECTRVIAKKFDFCKTLVRIAPITNGGQSAKLSWLTMFRRVLNSCQPADTPGQDANRYNQALASIHRDFTCLASAHFAHVPPPGGMALMI